VIAGRVSELGKKVLGSPPEGAGYFCATSGTVTDEMIEAYLERNLEIPEDTFTVIDGAQEL
jgi:hypothetical protein